MPRQLNFESRKIEEKNVSPVHTVQFDVVVISIYCAFDV